MEFFAAMFLINALLVSIFVLKILRTFSQTRDGLPRILAAAATGIAYYWVGMRSFDHATLAAVHPQALLLLLFGPIGLFALYAASILVLGSLSCLMSRAGGKN